MRSWAAQTGADRESLDKDSQPDLIGLNPLTALKTVSERPLTGGSGLATLW
ncbi:hypothetical protein [Saccharopolyspora phatthalungensis]|uniref:Uncharacterized protein n=1 Tax=Saccharopolyspora phatthalungensis TaxID=664693 RepID=A0A840QBZ0_9PSEU|nr:hypothetical protein [Saccharopolyspora phatthalungensis]MBB5160062.1 hypothetical protein [Saccharopolyspora phatthalungensis]